MFQPPNLKDAISLSLLTVFITFQPYYLYGEINLFELGIYLPGIQAVLDGQIPYRDFFHLRGPLELYIPALAMLAGGEETAVLSMYFYIGTIVTLMVCVFILSRILKTRLLLYLAVMVIVARTFPRVVFTFWGGFRFAFGVFSILSFIMYSQSKKSGWLVVAGLFVSLGFLTSAEIGIWSAVAVCVSLLSSCLLGVSDIKTTRAACLKFTAGILTVLCPYLIYLVCSESLLPFIDAHRSVAANMLDVFPQIAATPKTLGEAVLAAINPSNDNFKHMTPVYCFLFYLIYFIERCRHKKVMLFDIGIFSIFLYALGMYVGAFRNIWAAQFEMALQPEKMILFLLLEIFVLRIWNQKERLDNAWKTFFVFFLILGVIGSSVGYAIARYNHRFIAFQFIKKTMAGQETTALKPLFDEPSVKLNWPRVRGYVVPVWQAENFKQFRHLIDQYAAPQEKILLYPELAAYYFIADRPFVGRFPFATFSWLKDAWHEEFMADIKRENPKLLVMSKQLTRNFDEIYFTVPSNKAKYDETVQYLKSRYAKVESTALLDFYLRK